MVREKHVQKTVSAGGSPHEPGTPRRGTPAISWFAHVLTSNFFEEELLVDKNKAYELQMGAWAPAAAGHTSTHTPSSHSARPATVPQRHLQSRNHTRLSAHHQNLILNAVSPTALSPLRCRPHFILL